MMKENSPIGVATSAVRKASRCGVPIRVRPVETAPTRTTRVRPASASTIHQASPNARMSICSPIATKNTALNTSRMPSKIRSTECRCGVSATMQPIKNAPKASE